MNPPVTLAQFVDTQALPNLLPILAFEPDFVVQIRSADPRLKHTAKALREAARSAGFENKILDKLIPHPSPGAGETAETIASLAERHEGGPLLVNLACGTRLMALGAARAVGPDHTCFCCDLEAGAFIHLSGPPLPAHRPFADALAQLDVRTVMAAHGIDPAKLRTTAPDPAGFAFAQRAASLRETKGGEDAIGRYIAKARKRFHDRSRFLSGFKLDAALRMPLPPPDHDAQLAYLAAARDAGHVREIGRDAFYLEPDPGLHDPRQTHALAHAHFTALDHGWWQSEVCRLCKESGAFIDLRVETPTGRGADTGESGLVGISRRNSSLTFVSCMVNDQFVQPLEHALESCQRAGQLGGPAGRAAFVFHHIRSGAKRAQLRDACRALEASLVVGSKELATWLAQRA